MSMQEIVNALAKEAAERRKREILEDVIEIQTRLYEKASSYTNLVISVGYAGFYTTWAFLKDSLPREEMVLAALSMAVSIAFFILWEVFKALATTYKVNLGISDLSKSPPEEIEQKISLYWKRHRELSQEFMGIWRIIIYLVILPALFGIFILFKCLIMDLLSTQKIS